MVVDARPKESGPWPGAPTAGQRTGASQVHGKAARSSKGLRAADEADSCNLSANLPM